MSEHDLSEFYEEIQQHGPACSFALAVESLEADRQEKLAAAMADPTLPATAIARVVSKWTGTRVTDFTTRRHRKGGCSCG